METKVCSKCGEEKELSVEFWHVRNASKDGFSYVCKQCASTHRKEHYYNKVNGLIPEKPIPRDGYKYCSKCEVEKELSSEYFYRKRDSKDGYSPECKECRKLVQKTYRKNNQDKIKEYNYKYDRSEIGRKNKRNNVLRRRARKKEADDTLTTDEISHNINYFNNTCAYCGNSFSEDTSMNLDHILPIAKRGGTTKENIIPSCARCNQSKGAKYLGHWYIHQPFYSLDRLVKINNIVNNFEPWIIKAQEEEE